MGPQRFTADTLSAVIRDHSIFIAAAGEPPFLLSSGKVSRCYVDLDYAMSHAEASALVGQAVGDLLGTDVRAVGGPAHGADRIATAASLYLLNSGGRLCHTFSVQKDERAQGWVKGLALGRATVAVVDDVLTTEQSVIHAVQRCRLAGLCVAQVVVVVDREEGGMEALRAFLGEDLPVTALYRCSDLLRPTTNDPAKRVI